MLFLLQSCQLLCLELRGTEAERATPDAHHMALVYLVLIQAAITPRYSCMFAFALLKPAVMLHPHTVKQSADTRQLDH